MNATARLLNRSNPEPAIAEKHQRLVVVLSPKRRAPKAPFVILMLGLLVGGVVGLLLLNTHIQHRAYELGQLHRHVDELRAEHEQLVTELDLLNSPQQVASQAQRLGMVPAAAPVFIDLANSRLIGQPQAQETGQPLRLLPQAPGKPATISPQPIVVEAPEANAKKTSKTNNSPKAAKKKPDATANTNPDATDQPRNNE